MKPGWCFFAASACVVWASGAHAATYPVDDRASAPYESTAKMEWDSVAPVRGVSASLSGRMMVQVRLDVRTWQHRAGRIYLRLQNTTLNAINAAWVTNGRLLPGNVRSGERSLVYSGPIQTEAIDDVMVLTIHADGRRLVRNEAVKFAFEIDVD